MLQPLSINPAYTLEAQQMFQLLSSLTSYPSLDIPDKWPILLQAPGFLHIFMVLATYLSMM
jgi:hypothetical protein